MNALQAFAHRDAELLKLRRLFAEMATWPSDDPDAESTSAETLESRYLRWQTQHEPAPFWIEEDRLEIEGTVLELGEEGQAKRLEIGWDLGVEAPRVRVELGPTRELHFTLRPAPSSTNLTLDGVGDEAVERLLIERREVDSLSPLHPTTGLLNLGLNRRIHRKIDSRALRVDLTRRVYERLRDDGVCGHPSKIRHSEYARTLRELAEQDDRWKGFTGLLRAHPIEALLSEAFGSEPVDELHPQLFLPMLESYLPEEAQATQAAPQLREGVWPTSRSRQSALADLELWILLQQARAMQEQTWSVELPTESVRVEADEEGWLKVECALHEPVPSRRGDVLLVQDSLGRRAGKFLVNAVGQEELSGRLKFDSAEGELETPLTLVPIRSSYTKISRALASIRDNVAYKRDIGLSPALRAILGLEPIGVHLAAAESVTAKLTTAAIAEDPSQLMALRWALEPKSPLVLIQGPPGTGKTTLIEEICRQAVGAGQKVAVTGPSHPAVDNALRRLRDLPLLRVASSEENISEALRAHWARDPEAERRFRVEARRTGGFLFGGTHVGLLNDPTVGAMSRSGHRFDLLIVDEAGMSRPEELLLSLELADRAILIGDQQQLPPFPLNPAELAALEGLQQRPLLHRDRLLVDSSALELLVEERGYPSMLLTRNYRCHNPRLVELSSQLFYDSRVQLAPCSEYFRLPRLERQQELGPESLRFYDTARLPLAIRTERIEWEGGAPGYCSPLETAIVMEELERLVRRYPVQEICVISPYRLQVRLVRDALRRAGERGGTLGVSLPKGESLERWLSENVTTIDSFQGRECDVLLVTYVRSNRTRSSGFVGEPRRNNVTHTRARREMVIAGDLETLTALPPQREPLTERSAYVFRRMAEIVQRHGVVVALHNEAPYSTELESIWASLQSQELKTSAS